MNDKTIFQRLVDREIPGNFLYEDDRHVVILSIAPFEPGHTLVIPKQPYKNIFDIPENQYLELQGLVHRTAQHLRKTLKCDLNIIQNAGTFSEGEIDHIHIHLIPRTNDSKKLYTDNWGSYQEGQAEQILEKLKMN